MLLRAIKLLTGELHSGKMDNRMSRGAGLVFCAVLTCVLRHFRGSGWIMAARSGRLGMGNSCLSEVCRLLSRLS